MKVLKQLKTKLILDLHFFFFFYIQSLFGKKYCFFNNIFNFSSILIFIMLMENIPNKWNKTIYVINTLLLQNTGHMMDNDKRNLYQILVFLSCSNGLVVNETPQICHTAGRQSENKIERTETYKSRWQQLITQPQIFPSSHRLAITQLNNFH